MGQITLTIDERIEKAQKKVLKYSQPYNEAVRELKLLLDEKNKTKQERLLEAVENSSRSYDEIMEFICSDPSEDTWYEPGQGF